MGPAVHKGKTKRKARDVKRASKTKARTKDIDQIHDDLKKIAVKELLLEVDPDLPGLGQFYCVEAAKDAHIQTKLHKKRLKVLKDAPYSQAEAEAAVGLKTDNGTRKSSAMVLE